ncbi:MAG: hypothetical protein ABSE79_23490 [Terriglobia bacterium]
MEHKYGTEKKAPHGVIPPEDLGDEEKASDGLWDVYPLQGTEDEDVAECFDALQEAQGWIAAQEG